MGPITDYELGKARHRELEAEFGSHWGENVSQSEVRISKQYRLMLGLGSIVLGTLMIVQSLIVNQ